MGQDSLSPNSTEQEVAQFFKKKFSLKEEITNKILRENITGEVVNDLTNEDYNSLGISTGDKKKIKSFLKNNADKNTSKITEKSINIYSTKTDVKKFFENYLNFKSDLNLNGYQILNLTKEKLQEMGLSIGQRIKLNKYIDYMKKQSSEISNIREGSNKNEVAEFLKNILKFSDESIRNLDLDGESIFLFEEEDEDMEKLTEEEKERFINFIRIEKNQKKANEISSKEDKIKRSNEEATKIKDNTNKNQNQNKIEKTNKNLNIINNEALFKDKNLNKIINKAERVNNLKNPKPQNEIIIEKNEQLNNQNNKEKTTFKNHLSNKIEMNENSKEDKNKLSSTSIKNENNNIINNLINKGGNFKSKNIEFQTPIDNKKNIDIINSNEKQIMKNKNDIYEEESKSIKSRVLRDYKIQPIIEESKFNFFFSIAIKEEFIGNLNLSVYKENSYSNSYSIIKNIGNMINMIFKKSYTNYKVNYIHEENFYNKNKQPVKILFMQIPMTKNAEISIDIYDNEKNKNNCKIPIKSNNYYYLENLYNVEMNYLEFVDEYKILTYFLNCFFKEKANINKNLQRCFLEAIIKKVNNKSKSLKLSSAFILDFFMYCNNFGLSVKNIINIELYKTTDKIILKEEYKKIINYKIDKNEEFAFYKLIIKIIAINFKDFLVELIESKGSEKYYKYIIELINEKTFNIIDLKFHDIYSITNFQKTILNKCETKNAINDLFKISVGFVDSLKLINEKYNIIIEILMKENEKKKKTIKKNDDIQQIYELLKQNGLLRNKNDIKILDYKEIFNSLYNLYNDSFDNLLKLKKIAELLKPNLDVEIIEIIKKYYRKVHEEGKKLTKNKKMNLKDILDLIYNKDIYYQEEKFINERDPEIFINISIKDPKNIELLKNKKIWKLFINSKKEKVFYSTFLKQIQIFKDFKYLFEIFPLKNINKEFTQLIYEKISYYNELIYSILDEKKEEHNTLFNILQNILIIEKNNNIPLFVPEFNYDFIPNFYLFLLENKNDKIIMNIINELSNKIINFFIKQYEECNVNQNPEFIISIISLLKKLPNKEFQLNLLNKFDEKQMTLQKDDFYKKIETKNFILFKYFLECNDLIEDEELSEGKYLKKSIELKNEILEDLKNNRLIFDLIDDLIDEQNILYEKILIIVNKDETTATKIVDKIKEGLNECQKKLDNFVKIKEYYQAFFEDDKKDLIDIIEEKIFELRQKNINDIVLMNEKTFIGNLEFDFEESLKESENLKYKDIVFFKKIYKKKKDEKNDLNEKEILNEAIETYKDTIQRIIQGKENNETFFEIPYIENFMNAIIENNINWKKEIEFISNEFQYLNKNEYINNYLEDDLINYSKKDKVQKLIQYLKYFIESFCSIYQLQKSDFSIHLKNIFDNLSSKGVTSENIKEGIQFLDNINYDINEETSLTEFYASFFDKIESISFIKRLKDLNFDIRNLNEFIDELNIELQSTAIDNLFDIYNFINNIIENNEIKTDENFHEQFRLNFKKEKNIIIKFQSYLSIYGEIIQLYKTYDKNPELTIQKIIRIIKKSTINIIYEDSKYTFYIKYIDQKGKEINSNNKDIDELKEKINISYKNKDIDKKEAFDKFKILIENITNIIKTLNNLEQCGYPNKENLLLTVEDSFAYKENDKDMTLERLNEEFKNKSKAHKKSIKTGYRKYPILRLFDGRELKIIYDKIKNNKKNILPLLNSKTLDRIKEDIQYENQEDKGFLENVTNFLNNLFDSNKLNIYDIYANNKIKENLNIKPGLYRKVIINSSLQLSILNLYSNLTEIKSNLNILNNILICDRETNLEKIKSFLYRAILCDEDSLFVIANLEKLPTSIIQKALKILKTLYKNKNQKINSYLVFFYEKNNSGLSKDLETIIYESNILRDDYLKSKKEVNIFKNIEVYSSTFAGYGKTTEIKYKVKENKGNYYFLPIGGSFTINDVIENLENLNIDLENGKNIYLHINLSESENKDLMDEVLFKLLVLRFIESKNKYFYLSHDINIIIEIPTGFSNFEDEYKILKIFKNRIKIDKLLPLRIEENNDIPLVAYTLKLYDSGDISTKFVDLKEPINIKPEECEEIINKHFKQEYKNYYQKMNFIKFLSSQFKKFHENYYINNKEGDLKSIGNVRIISIKNFIELTIIFTCSIFQKILFNDHKIYKEIIDIFDDLEKNKMDPFNLDIIRPSLIFFNLDGHSISIITNSGKKEHEHIKLKVFYKSNIPDYKHMNHDKLLEEVKKVFNLNSISLDELKEKCKELGNYIFVSDNFIKMIRILLNIEARIPVILMGETGVGKTKLIEMLVLLYDLSKKRKHELKVLQIHAGITDKDIVSFFDKVTKEKKEKDELSFIFLDEINTCNSLGLIEEIVCNHTYLGNKLRDEDIILCACNPYRKLTDKMSKVALVYKKETSNKSNNLVYTVHPLPHSLLNFVIDFGSLKDEDEEKYIKNTIESILIKKALSQIDIEKYTEIITNQIIICQNFMKEIYDKSSVSLREIRRFDIFFDFFMMKYFQSNDETSRINNSINLALYLCYYIRLNDKEHRKQLCQKLKRYYHNDFIKIPERVVKEITEQMNIEKNKGIALCRVLRENLFTSLICILTNVPLIIIGKPGTGKSLSFQIIFNTMKGQYSKGKFFKQFGKIFRYYYQGSEMSTSEGIKKVFDRALKEKENDKNNNYICLVFFDEMGLAEHSINNPLKIMHYLLEKDRVNFVPFIGISNWRFDASKNNRTINLSIPDFDYKDLEDISLSISEEINPNLSEKYKYLFKILAETYYYYIESNKTNINNKDFNGNRDFYSLIKDTTGRLEKKKEQINERNKHSILTEISLKSLERNFGGSKNLTEKIINIFKYIYSKKYKYKFDKEYKESQNIIDIIKDNITDPKSRYLMLISEGTDGSDIAKYILNKEKRNYIELVGSKFKGDTKTGKYSEEMLNKIKYIMETDNVLILRDLDMIYPSLYDLFNQNFTLIGDKKFAKLAFEYVKIISEVNDNFHAIVIVNNEKLEELKLDPPFLNRFEKHEINYRKLLNEKDIEITKKIIDYIKLISSYNNDKKLKLNLEKLFVNCNKNNIEGLIFKIKNKLEKINNAFEYERIIVEKIFEKIVPTFCQDIIVSLLHSNLDKHYHEYNQLVKKIYQNSRCYNFKSFLEKNKSKKSIIYTFSKITKNLLNEGDIIENEIFGKIDKQSILEQLEPIESEKDITNILKCPNNKKLIVLKYTEKYYYLINSVFHIIEKYEKDNNNKKIIIIIIHKERSLMSSENQKENLNKFSSINEEYNQIFIDNLHGKENLDILQIISDKSELCGNTFINSNNILYNKLYKAISNIKFQLLYETNDFNENNITLDLTEKILANDDVKQLIKSNLAKQGESISIQEIIEEAFYSDNIEINNVDFFEVISTKLSKYYSKYLLNIIYHCLKEDILLPILNYENFEILMKNEHFEKVINNEFEKTKFENLKIGFEANKLKINNGFNLPKIKYYFDKLKNYIKNEIYEKYYQNESLLRKIHKKDPETIYNEESNSIKNNLKNEMNKKEYNNVFENIYQYNQEKIAKLLLEDYFKYYLIEYLKKKDYKYNEKLFTYFILLVKIISKGDNYNNKFEYTLDEFVNIVLITQGYLKDIYNFLNIFIDIEKYGFDIKKKIDAILKEDNIKYEISKRNPKYTEIVNLGIFKVIESLIRTILLISIDIYKVNKNNFYRYISSLNSIMACFDQINKKYYLFSKELNNFKIFLKLIECYKDNIEQLVNNFETIMEHILEQSIFLYNDDFDKFIESTFNLVRLFDKTSEKEFINMSLFIFINQYKIINENGNKSKIILIKEFLNKYPNMIKKSQLFISDTLKEIKPEKSTEENKNKEKLIENFIKLEKHIKLKKYEEIYDIYANHKYSKEIKEIILYKLENQCQTYFTSIINDNPNTYFDIILKGLSYEYFKQSVEYLYSNDNQDNYHFIKELYAIAYIKSYSYYFAKFIYNNFDKCDLTMINQLFSNKEDIDATIRKMIIIYILKIYFKRFPNYEVFKSESKKLDFLEEIKSLEDDNFEYIFNESFIPIKNKDVYINFFIEKDKIIGTEKINEDLLKEINQNFDGFYCFLVNNYLSFLYGNNKNETKKKLELLYNLTNDKIDLEEEGKILYKYLMKYDLLKKKIFDKIAAKQLDQDNFEILLYVFRILLNMQQMHKKNKNCFYNKLLNKNIYEYIKDNFIPGTFPYVNEFIKSYYELIEEFLLGYDLGYFICCDCGYLYKVEPCTCPTVKTICPNGHIIGGENENCYKSDIKVFPDKTALEKGKKNNSFISKTLEQFKKEDVDKYLNLKSKGIIENYKDNVFESNDPVRNLNNITYRLLHFILYSYLLAAYILEYLNKKEMENFTLVKEYDRISIFEVIIKDWNKLNSLLKEIGIENIQIFFNLHLDKIINLMMEYESSDSEKEFDIFEKRVNDYILSIINNKNNIKNINLEYHELNEELSKKNPSNIKEIIQQNYDPSIYSQKEYPNIQYFCVSEIYTLDTFRTAFNSFDKNKEKYALINILINKDNEIGKNLRNMQYLKDINKLSNLLLEKYSLNITREEAAKVSLKNEINDIVEYYNKKNPSNKISKEKFNSDYIQPFIEKWNKIKEHAVQYGCLILRDIEKGEEPLNLNIDKALNYFLVNKGDIEGTFLAAIYDYFISNQNRFIEKIILNEKGILKSYNLQLEQEIYIQDATDDEILNIETKKFDNKLLSLARDCSMRNIFDNNEDEFNYKNYNDIIYNYDYIEEELAKEILPRLKKFKNKIRFVPFRYEGFRDENSSIIYDFSDKYEQRELNDNEKNYIQEFVERNNDNKFKEDVFSSLQILMKEINNNNYNQNELIYDIIEKMSKFIKLNDQLVDLLKTYKNFGDKKSFTLMTLVAIFEFFEKLCWENIKKNIPPDYQLEISEEIKEHILNFFNGDKKLIDKKSFAAALRKLISRYISGLRQDIDIDSKIALKPHMFRIDLWNSKIIENENFQNEIESLCLNKIIIGQSFNLYNFIGEDELDNKDNKFKEEDLNVKNNDNEIEINTEENKEGDDSEMDDDDYEEEREIY